MIFSVGLGDSNNPEEVGKEEEDSKKVIGHILLHLEEEVELELEVEEGEVDSDFKCDALLIFIYI